MQKKIKRLHFIKNNLLSKKRDILKRENFSDISSEGYWRQIVLNAIGSHGFEQLSSIYKALKHFSESHKKGINLQLRKQKNAEKKEKKKKNLKISVVVTLDCTSNILARVEGKGRVKVAEIDAIELHPIC